MYAKECVVMANMHIAPNRIRKQFQGSALGNPGHETMAAHIVTYLVETEHWWDHWIPFAAFKDHAKHHHVRNDPEYTSYVDMDEASFLGETYRMIQDGYLERQGNYIRPTDKLLYFYTSYENFEPAAA